MTRPKNIVLLSDGTGNSASKLFKTNVWRLYQALKLSATGTTEAQETSEQTPGEPVQIAYYDDGVGTASFMPLAVLGGAFGWGLKRNVLDLYTFLCRHYQPGDNIYCFGFSRGAFTIRVLTGLIKNQGLVSPRKIAESEDELRRLAAEAFRDYRQNRHPSMFLKPFRKLRDGLLWLWYNLRPSPKPPYDPTKNRPAPNIRFLGLWDTVAAYGLPFDELTRAWDAVFPLSFPDHDLSNIVERACHALALDDERLSFQPELWNECEEDYQRKARENGLPPPPPIENRLVQVWFAGMHTNVGGGYPDDGMAHVPLDWMMTEADKAGLKFKSDERQQLKAAADINGKMYDSRQGAGGAYRYLPRKVKALTHDDEENEGDRVIIDLPKIHESVFKRIKNRTEGYAPIGLPDRYVVFKSDGSTISPSGPEAQRLDFVEHPTQAANRANLQEKVWNLVWWKRVFYFISVLVFVALAALPFYGGATQEWERPLSFLSTWIGLLNLFLPGFLGGWIMGCQRHPGLFSALALLFLLLLFIGSKLQLRIFDQMRVLWKPTFTWPIVTEPVAETPKGFLFNLRTNSAYQWIANVMKTVVLPFLAGAVVVVVLMIVLARGLYTVADSFGCFCTPATSDKSVFKTNDPCWDSGYRVEEGKRYRITIAVQANDLWKDDTIEPKDMGGFGRELMAPAMYLGIPLRRQFQENWFKPIARIGRLGGDEYPLDGLMPNEKTLVAEIKARRSGELFLFVNDTVGFYSNNHGSATVNIERLD